MVAHLSCLCHWIWKLMVVNLKMDCLELVVPEQEVLILTLISWVDWKPYCLPAFQISEYEQCCIDLGPCLQLHEEGRGFFGLGNG